VNIPGTKSWTPLPTHDITSLATNLRAVRGAATGYATGVLRAMAQAGVRPRDDVLLVGHSEGGMVAVRAAMEAHASGRFRITHIVTAGSPIGAFAARVPSNVEVLALENKHDVVPHLDGRSNADRVNVTTVTFDRDAHSIGANHGFERSYILGAGDVDASTDPSVEAFRAGAAGFFDAATARTERFVITRGS
jgi:pimeloyl-ACP methyl ester carboxylesterase